MPKRTVKVLYYTDLEGTVHPRGAEVDFSDEDVERGDALGAFEGNEVDASAAGSEIDTYSRLEDYSISELEQAIARRKLAGHERLASDREEFEHTDLDLEEEPDLPTAEAGIVPLDDPAGTPEEEVARPSRARRSRASEESSES